MPQGEVKSWKTEKPRKATLELRERIRALYEEGLTDDQIGERIGRSRDVVYKHRWRMGLRRAHHKAVSPETVARMRERLEVDEWPPGEIMKEFGLSRSAVHDHLGATKTGAEWNAVARWARLKHPRLYDELIA